MPTHRRIVIIVIIFGKHNSQHVHRRSSGCTKHLCFYLSTCPHAQFFIFISILSIQSEQNASIHKDFLEKTCSYTISSQARGSLLAHRSSFSSRTELRIGPSIEISLVVQYTNIQVTRLSSVSFYISQRNIALDFQVWPLLVHFSMSLSIKKAFFI